MASSSAPEGYSQVCSLSELQRLGKKRIVLNERVVVLFHVKGKVYALDHFCYHTGGPLEMGDIEDSHGRLCVVCPWHKHTITLDTGESLYTAIDPSKPGVVQHNVSKGVKQRTHHVKLEGDRVFLKLSTLDSTLDSDRYFTEEYRSLIENVLNEPVLKQAPQPFQVPLHSSRTNLPTRK